ncbi:hypothetical protein B0T25DRAFT_466211 [Lasiosphaeria hispida]|uniref:Uncharacterized protein n=1 Tax=Lasiosphaeria hispida TaxID=260671 RepID=A0AAJ0H8I8_9PEZI|nr:hypothetical protein B0T25DRAFT_466211 [Lasiosphaeria hispida]
MRLAAFIISTALTLSSGIQAWTKDSAGVWVANNNWYTIRDIHVHEACTRMNDGNTILRDVDCSFWTDGAG